MRLSFLQFNRLPSSNSGTCMQPVPNYCFNIQCCLHLTDYLAQMRAFSCIAIALVASLMLQAFVNAQSPPAPHWKSHSVVIEQTIQITFKNYSNTFNMRVFSFSCFFRTGFV